MRHFILLALVVAVISCNGADSGLAPRDEKNKTDTNSKSSGTSNSSSGSNKDASDKSNNQHSNIIDSSRNGTSQTKSSASKTLIKYAAGNANKLNDTAAERPNHH